MDIQKYFYVGRILILFLFWRKTMHILKLGKNFAQPSLS